MNIIIEKEWIKTKDNFIKNGKKLMVIGVSDSGKSTFILYLANEIFKIGKKVGVLDLDIGQSNIGPPGTISFGIVKKNLNNLSEIEPDKMYFIGGVSPKGNLLQLVVGSFKLLKAMEKEFLDYILVDTTGLVNGMIAEVLKHNKIEVLDPDYIIIFENENEIDNLIKPFIYGNKKIVKIKPSSNSIERTRLERMEYRNKKFREYFSNSKRIKIHFNENNIISYDSKKYTPLQNSIVGLLDKDRFLLYLGILESIDNDRDSMIIRAPIIKEKEIKFIKFSNLYFNMMSDTKMT
ncbi:MAG TPA: Clp1/GlmU family protein [Caldisericia bacterium]|nr:Clp1/GlmU family protein [Caldisericia bacterium]